MRGVLPVFFELMTDQNTSSGTSGTIIRILLGLVVVLVCGVVFWKLNQREEPKDALPVISQVGDFTLLNQQGNVIGLDDLLGRVWVADVIFTRCPGPCLKLTREMQRLAGLLGNDHDDVHLVSITTDPKFDSPEVLNEYARRFEADPDRWWFLTGAADQLQRLSVRDLKFVVNEKEEEYREQPEDLFIHSTYFMVVDAQGRLRAAIEGAEPGAAERVVEAVDQLKRESE